MKQMQECQECKRLYLADDYRKQKFCCRKCARINDARHGIPSVEDRKARILDAVSKAIDEEFKR